MVALTNCQTKNHPVWCNHENIMQLRHAFIAMTFISVESGSVRDYQKSHLQLEALLQKAKIYKEVKDVPGRRAKELDDEDVSSINFNTMYRFISFRSGTKSSLLLDAMALSVLNFMKSQQCKSIHKDFIKSLKANVLWESFQAYVLDQEILSAPSVSNTIASEEQNFAGQFGLSPRSYLKASRLCTGVSGLVDDEDRSAKSSFYSAYRYSSNVGQVVRSSICFRPATHSDPVCRFSNHLKLPDQSLRKVDGVIALLGETLYAIGNRRDVAGLKFMALTAPGQSAPNQFYGLTLSKLNLAIAARLVLIKEDTQLLESDIYTLDSTHANFRDNKAFRTRVEPYIRNHSEFKLSTKIQVREGPNRDWEDIDQRDMVSEVGRMSRDIFRVQSDIDPTVFKRFNPADHKHYPFNQAITIRNP